MFAHFNFLLEAQAAKTFDKIITQFKMYFILAQYINHSFEAAHQTFLLNEILTLYWIKAVNELMIKVLIFFILAFDVLHTSQIALNAQM